MKLDAATTAKVLALAGEKPAAKARRKPDVRTSGRIGWAVELTLACRVVSRQRKFHWTTLRRQKEIQEDALWQAMKAAGLVESWCEPRWKPKLPVLVTWTHVGRPMDSHDNLPISFKDLVDHLSDLMNFDDGDTECVTWAYQQEPGTPGCRVRIEARK